MKKMLMATWLVLSLFILFGCNGNNTATPEKETFYDWTKDPKYAAQIIPYDEAKYGSDESYDKARVKPDPEAVSGSFSEKIGYIENQWNIGFIKEYMVNPSLYETVTHKESFKTWLSSYIPYPIRIKENRESTDVWGIEVDAPSDKIPEIEATLKSLVDQEIIWTATHVSMILPQYDDEETRLNWSMLGELSSSSESPEFGDMKTIFGSRSWHLPYIGMDKLYAKGVNLKTDIGVGIIDGGLTLGHEDISSDVSYIGAKCIIDQRKVTHGSAVVGASTGSIMGNGLGVRGVIQAKTVFRDNQGTEGNFSLTKIRIEDVLNHPAKPRTVNLSISLGNDSYNIAMDKNSGTGKVLQFDKNKNFKSVSYYRELFASHSDVLFVIASGNAGISEPWDNAAVHYKYDKISKTWIYNPLNNVIVVAANGPDNILHSTSDFGQGVDISAPSAYMTVRYTGDGKSYYNTGVLSDNYGVNNITPFFSSVEDPFVSGNANHPSYGTSFSAPLVTGVATLLFSANPLLTPKEVKEYLTINSKVGGGLRYAGERWVGIKDGVPIKEPLAKPLPILDASASYDAVIANKTLIENLDVTTRDVQISIIDSNSIQDEYFNLVVNNIVIGKIENLPGSTTTYSVKLKSGDNLLELRITNTTISDTRLTMRLSPDGIEKIFQGDNISYAWTIRAP